MSFKRERGERERERAKSKPKPKPGMMVHACYPSMPGAEEEGGFPQKKKAADILTTIFGKPLTSQGHRSDSQL